MTDIKLDETPNRVKIVWGLYLLSFALGVTSIIGVILAYMWRGDASGSAMASHFRRQIRVFWIAFAVSVLGFVLTIVGIGFLILLGAAIYFGVMSVIGLIKAFDGKPWP
ncbi:hypothetical protein [Roseobacter sp. HKCCA0434]|uniref:DUF4870 family protein n=1 Tax=Roseobacter sp. HKCCA0434 TaxID=3079297 RepID=UPI002905B059|nr:hypothetical protein [Roseobacter sp. HKCCA0434]